MSIKEWEDSIIFMHKIVDGEADKSYGIHVAKLAGMPSQVIHQAKKVLKQLEKNHTNEETKENEEKRSPRPRQHTTFFSEEPW